MLALLTGRFRRWRALLKTDQACDWLDLTSTQFRRLMERLQIGPEDWYLNHYSQLCPLWAPEDIVAIPEEQIVAARRRGRRRAPMLC